MIALYRSATMVEATAIMVSVISVPIVMIVVPVLYAKTLVQLPLIISVMMMNWVVQEIAIEVQTVPIADPTKCSPPIERQKEQ